MCEPGRSGGGGEGATLMLKYLFTNLSAVCDR
jgi:hypothetical protein